MHDAHKILNVERDAEPEEIKKAYRAACMRWHPDRNPNDIETAERRFKEIQKAFKILMSNEEAIADAAVDAVNRAEGFLSELEQEKGSASSKRPATPWRVEGKSIMRIGGGVLFVGGVRGGQPHGVGDLILLDGSVHHGNFNAGRAEGPGLLFGANGTIFRGTWAQNRRVGLFEVVDPKGGRWQDAYDEQGKRTRRTSLATIRAQAASEATSESESARSTSASPAKAAKTTTDGGSRTDEGAEPFCATYNARYLRPASTAAAEAKAAEAKALLDAKASEPAKDFERMTRQQRQAASEARRLAGAAIRAQERRAEGGGFAGYSSSPRPRSPLGDEESATSLFGDEDAMGPVAAALQCRHCPAKFHPWRNSFCRQHNSFWMEMPEPIDRDEFPEGGMWLCCGKTSKAGSDACSIGKHEAATEKGEQDGRGAGGGAAAAAAAAAASQGAAEQREDGASRGPREVEQQQAWQQEVDVHVEVEQVSASGSAAPAPVPVASATCVSVD